MAHSFEPGQFPIHGRKPIGVPCVHLEVGEDGPVEQHQCKIHERLMATGWNVCAGYDCFGAGQMVSSFFEEMGIKWDYSNLQSPEVKNMFEAFKILRQIIIFARKFIPTRNDPRRAAAVFHGVLQRFLEDFSKELRTSTEVIDTEHWFRVRFLEVIVPAFDAAGLRPSS